MRQLATVAVVMSLGMAGQVAAADMTSAVLSTSPGIPSNSVLINHNGQFTSALGAHSVMQKGDRVVLRDGASGSLTFADGCVVPLAPGAMATIGASSPCANASGGFQRVDWDDHRGGYALTAIAVGGLIAVGLGFGGVFDHHHHNPPQPVSP